MIRTVLLMLVMVAVCGCWQPYHIPQKAVTESRNEACASAHDEPSSKDVVGILDMLGRDGVEHVDVLMIHGMCQHGNGWVAESFNSLLKHLPGEHEVDRVRLKKESIPILATDAHDGTDCEKALTRDLTDDLRKILGRPKKKLSDEDRVELNAVLANTSTDDAAVQTQRKEILDLCNPYKQTRLYSQGFKIDENKMLWLHAIVWSPVTTPLKRALCYDVRDRGNPVWTQCDASHSCRRTNGRWEVVKDEIPEYEYHRATFNASFKEKLMNDCISDAFIYLGDKRQEIQAQVALALIQAAGIRKDGRRQSKKQFDIDAIKRAAREESPLILISESLGSKVLFDTLLMMIANVVELERLRGSAHHPPAGGASFRRAAVGGGNNLLLAAFIANGAKPGSWADIKAMKDAGLNTLVRTEQIFLGSNQIPLLSLSEKDVVVELIRQISVELPSWGDRFSIAAFSDPSDFFSYTLENSGYAASIANLCVPVIDVAVSNSASWLGVWEWPNAAHEGYRTNNDVKQTILCGMPLREDCPEIPGASVKGY